MQEGIMVFTREVDSMINKLQKLTMTTGVLALVFILPMALSAVISKTAGGNGITENYCSLPFWICISFFIICTAVTLLYLSLKERHGGWQQKLAFPVITAVLAGISVFVLYVQVVNPLRDIPYLNSPDTVLLNDVSFYYNNISDSPTIQISGMDADGRRKTFSISREEFKEGKELLMQTQNLDGSQALTAAITYLPYSEMILDIDMTVTDRPQQ